MLHQSRCMDGSKCVTRRPCHRGDEIPTMRRQHCTLTKMALITILTQLSADQKSVQQGLSVMTGKNKKWHRHPHKQFVTFLKSQTCIYPVTQQSHSWACRQEKWKLTFTQKTCAQRTQQLQLAVTQAGKQTRGRPYAKQPGWISGVRPQVKGARVKGGTLCDCICKKQNYRGGHRGLCGGGCGYQREFQG